MPLVWRVDDSLGGWKFGGVDWGVHDTQASWQNGAYEDPNMNEEWWGLVDLNRNQRRAFTTYSQWLPPVAD